LCLLSCLAVQEEEEESCKVSCVCQISKSNIPKSYFVKIEETFSLSLRLILLLHTLLLLLLPSLLSIHALQFAFLPSFVWTPGQHIAILYADEFSAPKVAQRFFQASSDYKVSVLQRCIGGPMF